MTAIKITSDKINDVVLCPTSKSYANRALICALLSEKTITISDLPDAKDVAELIEMFIEIGININRSENAITIEGHFPKDEVLTESIHHLTGSEGGTTLRFLIPLLALGSNCYHIKMLGGLANRPMQDLVSYISSLGGFAQIDGDIFIVKGPINLSNKLIVDCSQTTQFASGFKLLSAYTSLETKLINIEGSHKYLDMTDEVIRRLDLDTSYRVPYDASSLGYLVVHACISQNLNIRNAIEKDSTQADSKIFDLFDDLGIKYNFSQKGLDIFGPSSFNGFEVNGAECIDLVPTLIVLASFANSKSTISNLKNLKFKESNRLEGILHILDHFSVGKRYHEDLEQLEIYPVHPHEKYSQLLEVEQDHRMIMTGALMLKLRSGGELTQSSAVSKSFSDFFDVFN